MKKIIFLITILLATIYGKAQILTMNAPATANAGTQFAIELNPTGPGCTSQSITLNIGSLQYNSASLQPGATITNSAGVLTISNIVCSGTGGCSQTMYVYVQFPCGTTCNGATQIITATLNSVGCGGPQTASRTVTAVAANNSAVTIQQIDPMSSTPVCFGSIVRYKVFITNYGNTYNISGANVNLELANCADIIGVYDENTFTSTAFTAVSSSGTSKIIKWSTTNLYCNSWKNYDLYVRYPCVTCIAGLFTTPRVSLSGNIPVSCGGGFTTATSQTTTAFSNSNCAICNAAPGYGLSVWPSFPCPTGCSSNAGITYSISIPPGNVAVSNLTYTLTIPSGLNITSVSSPSLPCAPVVNYFVSGVWQTTLASTATQVRWVFPCTVTPPVNLNYFTVNFAYSTTSTPAAGATLSFPYSLTASGATILSGTTQANVSNCTPTLIVNKQVKKITPPASTYSSYSSGAPGDSYTYRFQIKNTGSGAFTNCVIEDVLNTNHVYTGNLKYAYGPTVPTSYTIVTGGSFTISPLGTATVTVPTASIPTLTIGGTGFSLPAGCTSTDYLWIEFDVQVKTTVTAGTNISNYCTIKQGTTVVKNSYSTSIGTVTLNKVGNYMYVKCPLSDVWSTTTNAKNGDDVDFKMKVVNEGSLPISLIELINLKPQIGDQMEFGSLPRNSGFVINYNCTSPIVVNPVVSPVVTFAYANNSVSMDRTMLCPPTGSGNAPVWTSCSVSSNWMKSIFPTGFTLAPGAFVEIIYKGKVSGTSGVAHNSFAFKVLKNDGSCINSDNSNLVDINIDNIGCPVPCPCSQTPHPYLFWLSGSGPAVIDNQRDMECDKTYTNELDCYQRYTINTLSPCGPSCQPDQVITTITYTPNPGSGLTGYTLTGNSLTATLPGTYEVVIKVKCNGVWCKECKLTFIQTKKCEPLCDNCKLNGQDKVRVGFDPSNPPTSYTVGTYPASTTFNAGLFLGSGPDTYTQIRANIVDVQLSSDNPACLQCYNTPNQWGSITSGNLSGFTSAVSTYGTIASVNGNNNPREIVFNAAIPTAIPMMTPLSLNLRLPGVNPLSCCCIHVTVFVKITFRNNKCEECSKVIKIEFDECGPNGNQSPNLQFGGHPQFRQHAPSNDDVKLMTDIKTNIKSN